MTDFFFFPPAFLLYFNNLQYFFSLRKQPKGSDKKLITKETMCEYIWLL